ncbi:hypothetical protein DRO21_07020 [archaeon]|nr:MAG: hypothetical protein DRO21_07020 [archaeon]
MPSFSLETFYELIESKSRKCFHYFRKPYLDRGLTPRDFVFSMAMPTSKYTRVKLVNGDSDYLLNKTNCYVIGHDKGTNLPFCRYVGHHFINLDRITVKDVKKLLSYDLELSELSEVKEGGVVRAQGDLLMEVYRLFSSTEEVLEYLAKLYALTEFYNDLVKILNAYVESCVSRCRATNIYLLLLSAFEEFTSDLNYGEYCKLRGEFKRVARGIFHCTCLNDYLREVSRVIGFLKRLKDFSYNEHIKHAIKLATCSKSELVKELSDFCDRWGIDEVKRDLAFLVQPSYASLDVMWNRLFSEFCKYDLEMISKFINVSDFLNKVVDSECTLRVRVGNHLINLIAIQLQDIISPIRYTWSLIPIHVPLSSLIVLRSQVVRVEHPEHKQ